MRCSHLNRALGDGQESSSFLSSWFSLAIRFSQLVTQGCRLKILNHSKRKTCQGSRVASLVFTVGNL